jgi:hypothetical protein
MRGRIGRILFLSLRKLAEVLELVCNYIHRPESLVCLFVFPIVYVSVYLIIFEYICSYVAYVVRMSVEQQ